MSTAVTITRLFMSKVTLDPTRSSVQNALADPWRMHAEIAKVAGVGREEVGRTLYRLEAESEAPPYLLIQSHRELDISRLKEAGFASSVATKNYAPGEIASGSVFEFRVLVAAITSPDGGRSRVVEKSGLEAELSELRAADSSVRSDLIDRIWTKHDRDGTKIGWKFKLKDGSNGRVGRQARRDTRVVDDEAFGDWLSSVLVGATLKEWVDARSDDFVMTRFTGADDKGTSIGWRNRLVVGVVCVTDPEAFAKTLSFGIGHGRGFGCGLVSIARMRGSK